MTIINIIYIIFAIPAALLNGFVIQKMWHWFIVPLGIGDIGLAHALGLSLMIGYLTHQANIKDLIKKLENEEEIEIKIGQMIIWIAKPLIALLYGWLYLQFM